MGTVAEIGILFDGCEGEWEECAYVPVSMASSPRRAKRLLMRAAGFILEPEMTVLVDGTCHMRPADPEPDEFPDPADIRYTPCNASHPDAAKFWRAYTDERRFTPPEPLRLCIRIRRAGGHYRYLRSIGNNRRQAAGTLRIALRPYWLRRLKKKAKASLRRLGGRHA